MLSDFVPSFIIIGAGSAGCVLANRLTASGKHTVWVLEAGGSDLNLWVQMPIGYGKAFYSKKINWMYQTEPEPELNNRRIYWPRGKVIGGSSSINAMVYIRGHRRDFESWQAMGNIGWGWEDVLPYFKRSECNDRGADEIRGGDGPLFVTTLERDLHPTCENFLRAAEECGIQRNPDFNGESLQGAGLYQNTVKDGFRMSAARAYLKPAIKRNNVHVEKHAHVTRILFEGSKAVGVEYLKNDRVVQITAGCEVMLCAGAINSPQILQLSGVGPVTHLRKHGIEVVQNLPAVGGNLQDHLCIDYLYRSRVATLNDQLNHWTGKLIKGLRYVLTRRGPLSLGVNQGGGFVGGEDSMDPPSIQLFYSPVSYTKAPPSKRPLMNPDPFSGFLLGAQPLHPTSRGRVDIASKDPLATPKICSHYLSTNKDISDMIESAKLIRTLAAAPSLAQIIDYELLPGDSVQSDEELLEDIRDRASTVFHPVGTCRMGPKGEKSSVVDSRLKVHGIEGLRVVDASVFPTLTSGNTNAPTMMVAEKASDLILEQYS